MSAMSAPAQLPRRAGLDRETFWREHVLRAAPVIITDLLADAPIRAVTTRAQAEAAFGMLPLTIRPEYSRSLLAALERGPSAVTPAETMSLAGYFRHVDGDRATALMCIEEPSPAEIVAAAPPPALATAHDGGPDGALKSTMFIGNAGNFAPLHYDGDSRHVLLYQVFGAKRVVLLPARHGAALDPIANFSTLRLSSCSDEERRRLVAGLGGWEDEIAPGEAVFMPALVYHAADYLEDGMSVNFRFGRNRYHEIFSAHVHLDPAAQRLAASSLTEASVESTHRRRFATLAAELCRAAPSSYVKYTQMRALLGDLAADLDDGAAPADALAGAPFAPLAPLAPVVREALIRAHLFKDQLYRHRRALSLEELGVACVV
jgi:lysine-specific demethylase 8